MTVYLEGVMGLNFLVDFLLLLGTNRLSGFPGNGKRCAAGAVVGSLYSGICLVPGFRFLGSWLWRGVFLGIMGAAAFGWSKSALKRIGVFWLLSMALGGAAMSLGRGDGLGLILAAAGLWALCRFSFGGLGKQESVMLTVCHGDKTITALALRDSGNTLRDPITGDPVFLIDAGLAESLTDLSRQQLAHPLETLAKAPIPGLRLIPYRAVGCQGGLLLGLGGLQVRLGQEQVRAVIAFVPEGLGNPHRALVTG